MDIEITQTDPRRPPIWHCHCRFLAVLLLSVRVCAARGQDDLDKATVPRVPAVENKPHSDEFRVAGTRIIIVETSPGDSKTDVIRQIVQTLEKSHLVDNDDEYPELPGGGITVQLRILKEVGHEPLTELISGLGKLNLPEIRISLDRDDTSNKGIISATTEASVDAVARLKNYLTTQKFLTLTVTTSPQSLLSGAVAIEPATGTQDYAEAETQQLKIFSLKFSNANDASKIVQSLFGFPAVKVATDERTNSLIVSGDAGSLSEIEAILLKLDSSETAASPSNPLAARNGGNSIAAPTPIAEFRQRLDALEQPVQQLAEQVRATEAKLGKEHADSGKLRAELRALVEKTFAARQEIQRAELAEFTRRLQRMQQAIETRERIAEKIVDRRVEELLDPDATWEQGLPSSALAHETGNSNEVLRKKQAKRLAAEARQALKVGRLDLARSLAQQAKQLDISWDVFDDHPVTILTDIDNLRSTGSNLLRSPNLDATEKNGLVFKSNAAAADRTSPPKSDAEKTIARMVFVFFQDEARRAVPGLMIDHGTETLVLTTGPAAIVPDGVGHAIARTFLEIPGEADVASEFIDTKTADIRFNRAKQGLTKFQLNEPVELTIGDSLSAIIISGQPNLRVTPNAARISALDQATTFSLATHKFRHEFSGLVQIDQRLPEGTPLFKDGQLAGITLLGTRFMKDGVPGSYVVPASRIVEVLKTLKTE